MVESERNSMNEKMELIQPVNRLLVRPSTFPTLNIRSQGEECFYFMGGEIKAPFHTLLLSICFFTSESVKSKELYKQAIYYRTTLEYKLE
jgi:hypothetical protein